MTDYTPLITETPEEHPFAQFVRILGKGKRGARGLDREEARGAMGMLLDGKVEDTQLGAFLMLLRHKEESPEKPCANGSMPRPCRSTWTGRPMPARSATCPGICWPPSAWPRTA